MVVPVQRIDSACQGCDVPLAVDDLLQADRIKANQSANADQKKLMLVPIYQIEHCKYSAT
jgi:hypothetical protein